MFIVKMLKLEFLRDALHQLENRPNELALKIERKRKRYGEREMRGNEGNLGSQKAHEDPTHNE